jgi:hypothetical protein
LDGMDSKSHHGKGAGGEGGEEQEWVKVTQRQGC